MEIDIIRQLKELIRVFGIQVTHFGGERDTEALYAKFDQGLRKFLGYPFDVEEGLKTMEEHYEEKMLYIVKDSFEEYYMSFLIPGEHCRSGEKEFIQIGPYIMEEPDQIVKKVIEKHQLPLYIMNELKEYYYSIPLLVDSDALLGVMLTQMGYLCRDRDGLKITQIEESDQVKNKPKINWESENPLSMAAVEDRKSVV